MSVLVKKLRAAAAAAGAAGVGCQEHGMHLDVADIVRCQVVFQPAHFHAGAQMGDFKALEVHREPEMLYRTGIRYMWP